MDGDTIAKKYRAPVFIAGKIGIGRSGNAEIVSVIKHQAFDYIKGKNK